MARAPGWEPAAGAQAGIRPELLRAALASPLRPGALFLPGQVVGDRPRWGSLGVSHVMRRWTKPALAGFPSQFLRDPRPGVSALGQVQGEKAENLCREALLPPPQGGKAWGGSSRAGRALGKLFTAPVIGWPCALEVTVSPCKGPGSLALGWVLKAKGTGLKLEKPGPGRRGASHAPSCPLSLGSTWALPLWTPSGWFSVSSVCPRQPQPQPHVVLLAPPELRHTGDALSHLGRLSMVPSREACKSQHPPGHTTWRARSRGWCLRTHKAVQPEQGFGVLGFKTCVRLNRSHSP